MAFALLLIVAGLLFLTLAADRFVVAAARLAEIWGMSTILIGALVVGMGTSAPEFIVSVVGGGRSLDLAIGNIAGSNIANLTLVLGASVMVSDISGQQMILRREGVLTLTGVALFALLMSDGDLTRIDGAILATGMAVAVILLIRWASTDDDRRLGDDVEEFTGHGFTAWREVVAGAATLVIMLLGAGWLADGALRIASELGVSEGFVGLTVVAIGTSLPELATAIAAARRRENELVVGNLLGSNLFNSLTVGSGVALIRPGAAQGEFGATLVVMVGVAALAGFLAATGNRLIRAEGAFLLAVFAAYLVFVA